MVVSGFHVPTVSTSEIHDLMASPFHPHYVTDTFWSQRYSAGYMADDLQWSRDGSVAAITISLCHPRYYGCAYDFLNHQALLSYDHAEWAAL